MATTRRRFLCACGALIPLTGCLGGGGDEDGGNDGRASVQGCALSANVGASAVPGCGQPVVTSGNVALDQAFAQEFYGQQAFFGLPGVSFSFLSDCDAPNAFANPANMAILFGTSLAQMTYAQYGTPLPLWQVLAHEFGHMMQFAYGASWLDAPTVAPKELEADMFSGFYLIYAKSFVSPAEMQTTLRKAFEIGDFGYNNRNHHGTPIQRMAAVVSGGRVANEYVGGQIPRTVDAIRQRFYQELGQVLAL